MLSNGPELAPVRFYEKHPWRFIYLFIYLLKTSLNTMTNQPVLKYLQIERLLFIRPGCAQTTTPPPSPSEPLPKSVEDTVTIYLTDYPSSPQ
jgi:hypothetical protein